MSSKPLELELEVREDEAVTRRVVRFMCVLTKTQMAYLFVSICFAFESMPIYVRKMRSEGDLKLVVGQRLTAMASARKRESETQCNCCTGKLPRYLYPLRN
jgi:hypothetical protein